MVAAEKKYTLEELHIGMEVKKSQLSNILDTPMLLINTIVLQDGDVKGTLAFYNDIGEYTKYFKQNISITPVFFNSEELEDGIVYDE